jgi:hypothetical protein
LVRGGHAEWGGGHVDVSGVGERGVHGEPADRAFHALDSYMWRRALTRGTTELPSPTADPVKFMSNLSYSTA